MITGTRQGHDGQLTDAQQSLYSHRRSLIARAKDEAITEILNLRSEDDHREAAENYRREAEVAATRFAQLRGTLLNTARDNAERVELYRQLAAEVEDIGQRLTPEQKAVGA